MKEKQNILLITLILVLTLDVCGVTKKYYKEDLPINQPAKELYDKLKKLSEHGILFGHQDDLAYGIKWKNKGDEFRSDVNDVSGDFPAVFGWDIGHLELGNDINLDTVNFEFMKKMIIRIHEKGGINTISWHLDDPVYGGNSWTEKNVVQHIFPGGSHHYKYKGWLKRLATFFLSLKDSNGEMIPVVFRPYHEMNGSWFWWGGENCSPEDYVQLWRMTYELLGDDFGVNNLLYAYSPNFFLSEEEFLSRYPGDEYVDILGLDIYDREGDVEKYVRPLNTSLEILKKIATEKGKLYALTETGRDQVPEPDWWTDKLYANIKGKGLAWVLIWRNAWLSHYYGPYPGQTSENDFKQFYKMPDILFLKDLELLVK